MRALITLVAALAVTFVATLVATPALAAWDDDDYREERELRVGAAGVGELAIRAGAGSMVLEGERGADEISVQATIIVADADDDDEARTFIAEEMMLSLDRDGDRAVLVADFRPGASNWGSPKGAIALQIRVPEGTALDIDDGSGSIVLSGTRADVRLEDGSGSLKIRDAANVEVDDGAGSIEVTDSSGDVRIRDGSGSITIEGIGGDVLIDDGSGSISVREVDGNFRVTDDGSGSVRFSGIDGRVEVPDR